MNPTRACCLVVVLAVAGWTMAACAGVEQRTGVIAEPLFDEQASVWEHPNAVVFVVDLDRGVKNNSVILASAPQEEISCASGSEFAPELAVEGAVVEFDIDTGQNFDTSDPPAFTVTNLVVDC